MRLFETNETEAIDSPTPRINEAKRPYCKIYNPMLELKASRLSAIVPMKLLGAYGGSQQCQCAE